MRLRDLFTGDLTRRELITYIRYLPRDSALGRALLGEAADWSPEMHRLTDVAELLAGANWQRANGKGPKPKPIKRPRVVADDM